MNLHHGLYVRGFRLVTVCLASSVNSHTVRSRGEKKLFDLTRPTAGSDGDETQEFKNFELNEKLRRRERDECAE